MATAQLPIEAVAAIVLFIVVGYIILGPYLYGFVKGYVVKWTSPQLAEGNAISLALCEYRQARAEYPFQWSSKKSDGSLNVIASGLSECEWLKTTKLGVVVKSGPEITSCKTLPIPEPVSSCSKAKGECRLPTPSYCYDGENDVGGADCGIGKHCCMVPESVTAYLAWDPRLPQEEQYRMSSGNAYKIIAERTSALNLPDACMCLTADLQRHECW